jgi:hypothetical protein
MTADSPQSSPADDLPAPRKRRRWQSGYRRGPLETGAHRCQVGLKLKNCTGAEAQLPKTHKQT